MRNLTWAALPLALMIGTGCSEGKHHGNARATDAGPAASQGFDVTGFDAVEVAGPDDVMIRQGAAFSIKADGPKEDIDQLEITLDGTTLSIGRKRQGFSFRDHDGVKIAITMPKLRAARLTGSGSIDADVAEGDAVKATVTGSGNLSIAKVTATNLNLSISGSGDIKVDGGQIGTGKYRVTGSGDLGAAGVAADDLDISVTGSGDVEAKASRAAEVGIMGSGDVRISGGATCSTSKMGSGSVTCN